MSITKKWYYLLRCSVLISLGLAVYYQTFGFGFVFDDNSLFIVNDPYIKSFDNINGIFAIFPKTRLVGIYSFALNYWINGLHPLGYHIFNFVIHLLTVGLVWATSSLLFKITRSSPQELPFIIAVLFLVHPCQTQAVTYISQRFESMATLFYLSSVYCYLKARISTKSMHQVILFVLAGVSAILGLMTKEVAVTIPLTLLAAELLLQPKPKAARPWFYIILVIGGFFFCLLFMKLVRSDLSIFLQTIPSASHDGDTITAGNYFLTQMRVFLTFLRLLLFPVNQNLDYDYPVSTGLLHPPLTLIGILVIGGIIFLIARLRRTLPLASFGLAWMLITFSINMAPRANVIFEHKLYLISFGFFLAMVVVLSAFIRPRALLTGLCVGIIAVLATLSFQRNEIWQNDLTLWTDVVSKSPGKVRVLNNAGLAFDKFKQYGQAIQLFDKAIEMQPNDSRSYMNRGDVYFDLGYNDQAMEDFNKVIAMDPHDFKAYINRAKIFKVQKNYKAAYADLGKSIDLNPNADAYLERGLLWMAQGHPDHALEDVQEALKIEPYNYNALIDRAGIYFCTGHYGMAVKDLNQAQGIDAMDFKVYKNRAFCFLAMGQRKEALKDIESSLRLNPGDVQMQAEMKNFDLKN